MTLAHLQVPVHQAHDPRLDQWLPHHGPTQARAQSPVPAHLHRFFPRGLPGIFRQNTTQFSSAPSSSRHHGTKSGALRSCRHTYLHSTLSSSLNIFDDHHDAIPGARRFLAFSCDTRHSVTYIGTLASIFLFPPPCTEAYQDDDHSTEEMRLKTRRAQTRGNHVRNWASRSFGV